MYLSDHAGLYGPGDREPGDTDAMQREADLEGELQEELEWLADQIAPRTALTSDAVLDVLWQRHRVLIEADSAL